MARFRRARRYGRAAARRFGGSARRAYTGGGGWKGMIAPVAGGAGDSIIRAKIGVDGVGSMLAGWGLGDQTTLKIGLNKGGETLGSYVAAMFFGGSGGSSSGMWL